MRTDVELLRDYAEENSEAAFGELVRRQVKLVYSIALRQCGGDAHLAEDVTQRVFADLARRARSLSGYTVLGGWLYRRAQFVASDIVRADHRRRAREQEAQAMQDVSRPAIGDAEWQKLAPVLDQAIGELPDRDRDAIVLRFIEARPFREIGATLRLSEDAARMRVERTLDKLRVNFERRGITSTTGALALALAHQAGATLPVGLATSVTSAAVAGAAIGGVGAGAAAGAFWTFMTTTKTGLGIAGALTVIAVGSILYQNSAADERPLGPIVTTSLQPEKTAAKPAAETLFTAAPPAAPVQSSGFYLKDVSGTITLNGAPPADASAPSYPPMVLSEVLQPKNQFNDALFGVSATFPEGWKVMRAERWGQNNRENTVFLQPTESDAASTTMYYQNYPKGRLEPQESEAWLRRVAQTKEDSRRQGAEDYKNVADSFVFKLIDGHPSLSYYAVYTEDNEVLTEHFIRVLGQKGYVMITTRGPLEDVQTIMPKLEQMAATVRVP